MLFFGNSKSKEKLVAPQYEELKIQLDKLTKKIFNNLKNELIGETDTKVKSIVQKYRSVISKKIMRLAQHWSAWKENNGPVLYPNYCRSYYRKGTTEMLVMEFPPQTRLLKFKQCPWVTGMVNDKVYHYSLALPYTIFFARFLEGKFETLYLMFSPTPIKSLTDKPCKPFLPNVYADFKICMGQDFDFSKLEKGDLTQQTSYALHHFWNSYFSSDLAQYWAGYRSGLPNNSPLKSLEAWQEASTNDPLFVIDAPWQQHSDRYGDILGNLFKENTETATLQQDIFQSTYDSIINDLEEELEKIFDAVDPSKKLEDHTSELMNTITSVNR